MGKPAYLTQGLMWFGLTLGVGLVCIGLVAFLVLWLLASEGPADRSAHDGESEYSFDTDTIQTALAAGQQDVFKLEWQWESQPGIIVPRPTSASLPPKFPPMHWSESDFERVIRASVEMLHKEPLNDVELYEIFLRTSCQQAEAGPQSLTMGFFQVLQPPEPENYRYLRRDAHIDLATGRLNWYEGILSEVAYERPALDVNHITAEAALQIAEGAGGANLRTQVDNQCDVWGHLTTTGTFSNEWRIEYRLISQRNPLFTVRINAQSGELQVVTPTP